MAKDGKKQDKGGGSSTIVLNKKAGHDFFIEQRFECGLMLEGWEVKALRAGRGQIKESYVTIRDGEAFLFGAHIPPCRPPPPTSTRTRSGPASSCFTGTS